MKWLWWGVGALVIAVGVGLWMLGPSTKKDAVAACREAVSDQLVSPASAKFSGETIVGNDSPWTFLVDVDSQNDQGALVRSRWACNVTLTDGRYDAKAEIAR